MSSASRCLLIVAFLLAALVAFASEPPLRICADPSNLPFSNTRGQGFENVLAQMVAHDLQRDIQFVWWPQRARFVEKRLKAQTCDLVMAVTSTFDLMVPTQPYYRSTYVFVSRSDRNINAASLTDASLKNYKVGAQIVGDDDGAMVPPAEEMAKHGLLRNIVGYSLYGHPLADNPSAEIITAVEHGDVDIAVAWGPMAGYFAKRSTVPLKLTAICPLHDKTALPFTFAISMGVRRGDDLLLQQLNKFIARRQKEIQVLLSAFGVPVMNTTRQRAECR
jgi:mxaJ protein